VSEIESTLFPRNPGLKIEAAPAGELRLYVE
jgi:hypothetical protein